MPKPDPILAEPPRVVVEHNLKVKHKTDGKTHLSKPAFVVYLNVNTAREKGGTNLPIPDRYVGAIFVYRRDPDHPMDDQKTEFVRVAEPEEFMTLPDFQCKFNPPENPKAPPPLFVSHSAIRTFDDKAEAVKWRDAVLDQVDEFCTKLEKWLLSNLSDLKYQRWGAVLIVPGGMIEKMDYGFPGVAEIRYHRTPRNVISSGKADPKS